MALPLDDFFNSHTQTRWFSSCLGLFAYTLGSGSSPFNIYFPPTCRFTASVIAMYVLGHSLNQYRRKTSKPRDLHIRKVSFSGCSLSSGSSFSLPPSDSSTASTTSSYAPSSRTSPSSRSASRDFDPLSSHLTFMPPPRLHERPLLASVEQRTSDETTSHFLEDEETEYCASPLENYTLHNEAASTASGELELQSHHSLTSQRPPVICSRWSDSTIASEASTLSLDDSSFLDGDQDSLDEHDDPEEPQEHHGQSVTLEGDEIIDGYYYLDQLQDGHQSLPNFSYKRASLPKRPPIKMLDSLKDFIKRGGWKRRGIIFHCEDMDSDSGIADMTP